MSVVKLPEAHCEDCCGMAGEVLETSLFWDLFQRVVLISSSSHCFTFLQLSMESGLHFWQLGWVEQSAVPNGGICTPLALTTPLLPHFLFHYFFRLGFVMCTALSVDGSLLMEGIPLIPVVAFDMVRYVPLASLITHKRKVRGTVRNII